ALDSSAFQNATSGAAGELAQNIGANRMNVQQSAIDKLLGLSQNFLGQRPYDTSVEQKSGGFDWGSLLGGLAGTAGTAFLGPFGGAIGSAAGNWVGNKFK